MRTAQRPAGAAGHARPRPATRRPAGARPHSGALPRALSGNGKASAAVDAPPPPSGLPAPASGPPPAAAAAAPEAPPSSAQAELAQVAREVAALRAECRAWEAAHAADIEAAHPSQRAGAVNLAHYLALRSGDRRPLQNALQAWGLSSLGSAEAHVAASLAAVARALDALRGAPPPPSAPPPARLSCDDALERAATAAFGPSRGAHRARLCVTAPPGAAHPETGAALLAELLRRGMCILRINCAHDGADAWGRMVANLRAAEATLLAEQQQQKEKEAGSLSPVSPLSPLSPLSPVSISPVSPVSPVSQPPRCLVQFDLAGPKLRTGAIEPGAAHHGGHGGKHGGVVSGAAAAGRGRARWVAGETVLLVSSDSPAAAPAGAADAAAAVVRVTGFGDLCAAASPGDEVRIKAAHSGGGGERSTLTVTGRGPGWVAAAAAAGAGGAGRCGPGDRVRLRRGGATLQRSVALSAASAAAYAAASASAAASAAAAAAPAAAPGDAGGGGGGGGSLALSVGDGVSVRLGDAPGRPPAGPGLDATLSIDLPEVFAAVRPGHRVLFDDGKLEGCVAPSPPPTASAFRVLLTRASGGSPTKLAGEKGINLPDTELLALPAVGPGDAGDAAAFAPLRPDLVAASFVQTPADVAAARALVDALPPPGGCGGGAGGDGGTGGTGGSKVGLVLKIETKLAFRSLPALLFEGLKRPRLAVMVARGDLGVEVGMARLSEVQEEVLWLAEAAHVPVMWATQVLDTMARTGAPSRGEVTDAAASGRAEAVMLNKGPYMPQALELLGSVLSRMDQHERKRMHLLRKLDVAGGPQAAAAANKAAKQAPPPQGPAAA